VSLLGFDDAGFRAAFSGSPIKRIGRDRFLRNVLVAIGNSGDPTLAPAAEPLLDDASPLVRGAAVWALGRLLGPDGLQRLASARTDDPEAEVREEWQAGFQAA
jgi:epoxyqueuosine reductase